MYLLKKAIQIRENSHPDHEKPFLEHIDDLRTMITRIVITLLIAMIACFVFNKKIMDFFRLPVDQVLVSQIRATLPDDAPRPLTVELWGQARKVESAAANLPLKEREAFLAALNDDDLVFHAKTVGVLRAANALPTGRRAAFVDTLDESPVFKEQVKSLIVSRPNTDTDVNGNLKMMSALKPTEGFMLSMKLSFVAGIVVSFPLLLLFILQFILPGLHGNERRILWPAMAVGFGLFLLGSSFAYYLVLPRALLFFAQWSGDMGISNDWRIGEYISFATQFTLLFGISFELPVVVMVFVKLGMLTFETMTRTRSYAVVAIVISAALLTPTPDIATMLLMAVPMIILYEICIWFAYFDRKKNRVKEEAEAREREERLLSTEERRKAALDVNQDHWKSDEDAEESGDDGWNEADFDPDGADAGAGISPDLPEIPPVVSEEKNASDDDPSPRG